MARWTDADLQAYRRKQRNKPAGARQQGQEASGAVRQVKSKGKGPNATEAEYRRVCLAGKDARYEAISFRLANGHRYTPDWVVVEDGHITECHEVKGSYRFHSHGRARLAFDQAKLEFPGIRWVWATKQRGGDWRV